MIYLLLLSSVAAFTVQTQPSIQSRRCVLRSLLIPESGHLDFQFVLLANPPGVHIILLQQLYHSARQHLSTTASYHAIRTTQEIMEGSPNDD
jgi:hypothetical protein